MDSERYLRQTTLKGFGINGQQKLLDAKVLVVGAGGLGVPVLTYLNAMGVGTIGIVDNDKVAKTNLHRQVLYNEADIDHFKVTAAAEKLKAQNSITQIKEYKTFLTTDNALEIIADYNLVIDASDNFPTRYLINDACVILKKPFVYGALHGFEGQVSVFNYNNGPTYRCLFPNIPKSDTIPNCNDNGVLGILPGIIGNLQALEAIKIITGIGNVLSGKLLLFDALTQSYQKINFKLNKDALKITELQEYEWIDSCEVTPSIAVTELEKLLEKGLQVIDVRTLKEYNLQHLPNTNHIPLASIEDNLDKIDFSVPVYFLCQSGKRSEMAVKQLQKKQPESTLFNVLGGINQYLEVCS